MIPLIRRRQRGPTTAKTIGAAAGIRPAHGKQNGLQCPSQPQTLAKRILLRP
jgi:hypothetical protein